MTRLDLLYKAGHGEAAVRQKLLTGHRHRLRVVVPPASTASEPPASATTSSATARNARQPLAKIG
jgi:hypothetical protein